MNKRTNGEKVFAVFNTLLLIAIAICTLYPCIYVLFASISNPDELLRHGGMIFRPYGFNPSNYTYVFNNPMIWSGYANTIFYAVVGTVVSVFSTLVMAFCLSRKDLIGKNFFILAIVFTMYFNGGMIPLYLVIKTLHLLDNRAVMIIPGLVSAYNFIIVITYLKGLPDSIEEAATIDGANAFCLLFRIIIPLSKPVIAVISLYYLVGIWNNYMSALLYINSPDKYPLQLVLREILFQGSMDQNTMSQIDNAHAQQETIKYAVMVVSTVPVLCVYPFIQRYFVKGVMIGAVKG